jgi:hypothetical protein
MAERSKALRSGRSPLLWAWVRIPLLTKVFFFTGFGTNQGIDSFKIICLTLQVAEWRSGSVLGP